MLLCLDSYCNELNEPCKNKQRCVSDNQPYDHDKNFYCICGNGFLQDDLFCENCLKNFTLLFFNFAYYLIITSPYWLHFISIDSYCRVRNPCLHGGTCVPNINVFRVDIAYECVCPLGFYGKDCQYCNFFPLFLSFI